MNVKEKKQFGGDEVTTDDIFENIINHFQIVKRMNDKVQCKCPVHDDQQASLTISKGRKAVLFKCHAGCDTYEVLGAVGLELKDTFYTDSYSEKWRAYIEGREHKKIEAVYHYHSIVNGAYAYTKVRLEGKDIKYGTLNNDRFTYGLNGTRKSFKAIYGDFKSIKKAIATNNTIYIVEGEKDVNTMTSKGYTAWTYGGANDWQSEFANVVKGANVIILADNDKSGINVANTILNDIKDVTKSARIIVPMPDIPKADISDFFKVHSKEEFEQLIKQDIKAQSPATKESIYDRLIKLNAVKTYETNDKGNGRLFADIFKDKHRYNPSRKDFMFYDGMRWVDDVEGLSARQDAKKLSDSLVKYAYKYGENNGENKYLVSVLSLSNIGKRENMIKDSRDIHFFTNEQLDTNDYLLNVQNGVLDLSECEPKFIKHDPDLLLSKVCNAYYDSSAECPIWNKFLKEVMQDDTEKIKYLQKICGLSLTGNTEQEKCFILFGSTTRNGKSTFCETIIYLLGDYALTMKPESLAQKPNADSRQASGDIARLSGCRFVNASEPPKKMLFDTALLKSLLGRDSITARHLHQREFSFIPKFKLVMNTNYLPTINDDTVFSSGRINVISFDRHFTEQEQNKQLKNTLRAKGELSGILNWCIEGLRLYRLEGLEPPQAVRSATDTYRADSDKIGTFINERLSKSDRNSKAKDVYDCYSEWCSDNGYGCENKSHFFSELKNKGLFMSTGTVNGKTVKNAVRGYVIEAEFEPINDNLENTLFE